MNRNTTLILVGVFAVLLAYIFLVQQPAENAQTEATPTAAPVLSGPVWGGLTADRILGIEVEDRAQARTVAFGRSEAAAAWTVTAPQAQPADQLVAATNAATLANLQYRATVTTTTELSAFGVLSPTYVIRVTVVDGPALVLNVGDRTVTGTDYYVALEGAANAQIVNGFSLDPILGWLDAPPYLPPTATPEPVGTPVPETPAVTSTP